MLGVSRKTFSYLELSFTLGMVASTANFAVTFWFKTSSALLNLVLQKRNSGRSKELIPAKNNAPDLPAPLS